MVGKTDHAGCYTAAQVLTRKFKRIPFDPDRFKDRLANGTHEELEEMNAALLLRSQAIQKHMELIKQLEDEHLGEALPGLPSILFLRNI